MPDCGLDSTYRVRSAACRQQARREVEVEVRDQQAFLAVGLAAEEPDSVSKTAGWHALKRAWRAVSRLAGAIAANPVMRSVRHRPYVIGSVASISNATGGAC